MVKTFAFLAAGLLLGVGASGFVGANHHMGKFNTKSATATASSTWSHSGNDKGMGGLMGNLISDAATALKLSPSTVKADLKAGDTLATIAVDNGSSASALEASLLADAESALAAAVSAGKITSAKQTAIESKLSTMIDHFVTSSPQAMYGGRGAGMLMGNLISDAATALKLSPSTVKADLKAGDTLATIAVDNGSSASALEASLLAEEESALAAKVSAGKITSAEQTSIESKLSTMIDQVVTGHWGHPRPMSSTSTSTAS